MNRDKIGTQTCYIHQCTKRYVDVHSMSVSQSCLCSFLCNPYITLQIFYLLVILEMFLFQSVVHISLVPGLLWKWKRRPGIDCSRMREPLPDNPDNAVYYM